MTDNEVLDVLIVGAGPIGLACGIEAEKRKLSNLIIDRGCLVNSIYHFPVNMTFFSTSERLEIGGVPFISHSDKPTRREALEYYRRVKTAWDLKVSTYDEVTHVRRNETHYHVMTAKNHYNAKAVIIATGYYDTPNRLNIPGESFAKVHHYFKEAHPYSDQKVMVVGAGNSAVDVALECFRRGADVTMVIREPELKDSIKYWVKPDIENRIKEGGITAYFNASLTEIRDLEVDIQTPDGPLTIANDFVFAMTGYQPDYRFLQEVGLQCSLDDERRPCFDADSFETEMPDMYLAGVVCGGMNTSKWFIENARLHPAKIFDHMMEKRRNEG